MAFRSGKALSKSRLKRLREKNARQYLAPSKDVNVRQHVTRTGVEMEEVPIPSKGNFKIPLLEIVPEGEDSNLEEELVVNEKGEPEGVHDPDELKNHQTRTRTVIEGLMKLSSEFTDAILQRYANPHEDEECSCGRGKCLVSCRDCDRYRTSCAECFVESHYQNYSHWARVWDPVDRIFIKTDYSHVLPEEEGIAIELGHPGMNSSHCASKERPSPFIIVDSNGVHSTRIRFCLCSSEDKSIQLVNAGLFPATAEKPETAFTFAVLSEFQAHNLQSKVAAFDYILALRRLTDNIATHRVPNPYTSFLRVTRVWDYLTHNIRVGFVHNINALLPARPQNSVHVFCPSCSEVGINLFDGWKEVPEELSHLVARYIIADGNHKANRHTKNTDPKDRSLWDGTATTFFPSKEEYTNYLSKIPVTKEKSICSFIKAVNSQDKKKFRGNDETGIILIICNHVFVLSSTDMFLGERFAYVDYAISHALATSPADEIPLFISYDSACSYSVNVNTRFKENLPAQADAIAKAQFTIDSLHVHDHTDKCMYLYSSSYRDCAAHFHANAAEQYFSENNQIGPQTSQMNPGHRHDKLNLHHAWWNWKKTTIHSRSLAKGLILARSQYIQKQKHFRMLSQFHREQVPEWYRMDRTPRMNGGEIHSVYRETTAKALSLAAVHQRIMKRIATSDGLSLAQSSCFLTEGIAIEIAQLKIRILVARNETHPLQATQRDIKTIREDVTRRLEKWRDLQATQMGDAVQPFILSLATCSVEDEELYLPSSFPESERIALGITSLASEELELREGQLHDAIMQLRSLVKLLSSHHDQRKQNDSGQKQHTRSRAVINSIMLDRDHFLLNYNTGRDALVNLGAGGVSGKFPALTEADLYRKSTSNKRGTGDSFRPDGRLWEAAGARGGIGTPGDPPVAMLIDPGAQPSCSTTPHTSPPERSSGRLWDPMVTLSEEEVEVWEREADRVQWHRAWADMLRWLEEFELKHAEFVRCILSFEAMVSAWTSLSQEDKRPHYAAFARRQACIFRKLLDDARKLYVEKGEPKLTSGKGSLVDAVRAFRHEELAWLSELVGDMREVQQKVTSGLGSSSVAAPA